MMVRRRILGSAAGALLALTALSAAAAAAPGYVVQGINLRAGPDVSYPWIASLDPGTPVEIFGCLPGWTWCDVAVGNVRGWVAGVGLQILYDQQPEPLVGYGGEIGLPFIGFDFANYWDRYYRGRPWYSETDRWHGGGPGRDDHGRGWTQYGPGHGPERGGPERGGPERGGPGGDFRGGPRPGPEFHGAPGGGRPGPEAHGEPQGGRGSEGHGGPGDHPPH